MNESNGFYECPVCRWYEISRDNYSIEEIEKKVKSNATHDICENCRILKFEEKEKLTWVKNSNGPNKNSPQ